MEADTIAHLRHLAVQSVWVRHPGFDFLDDQLRDEIPSSRVKLYETVKRSFTGIAQKTSGTFDQIEFRAIIGDLIMSMIANKNNAVLAERIMSDDDELFAHCSNVAYLALVISMRIKEYIVAERKRVDRTAAIDFTNLGIGALLHDLGKLGLDREWHNVHCTDEGGDSDVYRSHAERGYQAVQGRIEPTAANVLLNHHQRFDGQGFPKRAPRFKERAIKPKEGHHIHIFSRVVAVANVMEGLMSTSQNRKLPAVAALAAIQNTTFDGFFDPVVLRAALSVIPPFPLGSVVELGDGRQAVVTDLNERKPCQPKVCVLPDIRGTSSDNGEELDLASSMALRIVRIGDQAVSHNAFYSLT